MKIRHEAKVMHLKIKLPLEVKREVLIVFGNPFKEVIHLFFLTKKKMLPIRENC